MIKFGKVNNNTNTMHIFLSEIDKYPHVSLCEFKTYYIDTKYSAEHDVVCRHCIESLNDILSSVGLSIAKQGYALCEQCRHEMCDEQFCERCGRLLRLSVEGK